MENKDKIKIVEDYVEGLGQGEIAHDFKHVHRVRNWALKIAKQENYDNLLAVEIAALMHDIGLKTAKNRFDHGKVGADMAREFLTEKKLIEAGEMESICEAIKVHNTIKKSENKLVGILRDADIMDLIGAVGVMRACMYYHDRLDYDPKKVRGEAWGKPNEYFTQRIQAGQRPAENLVDQLNFSMTCFDNLTTPTARELAKPLVEYVRNFILQVEKEVLGE